MSRRLVMCRHDRRLAGVAAGLSEHLDIDGAHDPWRSWWSVWRS